MAEPHSMLLCHFLFLSFWCVFLEIKKCPIFLFALCNCHKCIHKVSSMWHNSVYYCQVHQEICWLIPPTLGMFSGALSLPLQSYCFSRCPWILSLAPSWNYLIFSPMLDLMLPRSFFLADSLTWVEDGFQQLSE